MQKKEIQINKLYVIRKEPYVYQVVQILEEHPLGGWKARNLMTKREIRLKSARKLMMSYENFCKLFPDKTTVSVMKSIVGRS